MTSVKDVDVSTTLIGHPVKCPIGISPTIYHQLFHPDGEIATAQGKEELHFVYYLIIYIHVSFFIVDELDETT